MKKIDKLRAERDVQASILREIEDRIEVLESKTQITCIGNKYGDGCGKKTEVRKLVYIQTHWYESPWGCTGGDDWHRGEGNFDCPKCGHRNRLYNRQELEELKYLFKSIVEEY